MKVLSSSRGIAWCRVISQHGCNSIGNHSPELDHSHGQATLKFSPTPASPKFFLKLQVSDSSMVFAASDDTHGPEYLPSW